MNYLPCIPFIVAYIFFIKLDLALHTTCVRCRTDVSQNIPSLSYIIIKLVYIDEGTYCIGKDSIRLFYHNAFTNCDPEHLFCGLSHMFYVFREYKLWNIIYPIFRHKTYNVYIFEIRTSTTTVCAITSEAQYLLQWFHHAK